MNSRVEELRSIVGSRLLAYLVGMEHTRSLRDLPDTPDPRLETVLEILRLFRLAGESADLAAPFLLGMNPDLGDVAPARLIRADPETGARREVVMAVRAYLGY